MKSVENAVIHVIESNPQTPRSKQGIEGNFAFSTARLCLFDILRPHLPEVIRFQNSQLMKKMGKCKY